MADETQVAQADVPTEDETAATPTDQPQADQPQGDQPATEIAQVQAPDAPPAAAAAQAPDQAAQNPDVIIPVVPGESIDLSGIDFAAAQVDRIGDDLVIQSEGQVILVQGFFAETEVPVTVQLAPGVEIPIGEFVAAFADENLFEPAAGPAAGPGAAPAVPLGGGANFDPFVDPGIGEGIDISGLLPPTGIAFLGILSVPEDEAAEEEDAALSAPGRVTIGVTPVTQSLDEDDLTLGGGAPFEGSDETDPTIATGTFTLTGTNDASLSAVIRTGNLPPGLTSTGEPVLFVLSNGDTTLTAYTEAAGIDNPIFVATIAQDTGATVTDGDTVIQQWDWTFEIFRPLDHPDGLGENVIPISLEVLGFDRSTEDESEDMVVFTANFTDDVPEFDTPGLGPTPEVVDEDDLDTGTVTVNGLLNLELGADGPSVEPDVDPLVIDTGSLPVVTVDGVAVTYTVDFVDPTDPTTVFVLATVPGEPGAQPIEIFKLTVTLGDVRDTLDTVGDGNAGRYTFELFEKIDHVDTGSGNPNELVLNFGFTVTDFDQDSLDGIIPITVINAVPIATVSADQEVPEGADAVFAIELSFASEFDNTIEFKLVDNEAIGGDPAVDGSGVTVDFDNTEVVAVVVDDNGVTQTLTLTPDANGEFSVTIPAGQEMAEIRVTTIDEPGQETYEGEERFSIELIETADDDRDTATVLVDRTLGDIDAVATIVDDERADDDDESDVPYATIHGAPVVPEGALAGFQVQLSNPTALTVPTVVGFTLGATGDTADGGLGTGDGVTVDYDNTVVTVVYGDGSTATLTPDSGVFTLTYPTGVTTANIFVRTLDETGEDIYEGDETFTVELVQLGLDEDATVLVDETGAQGPVSAVGTIFDDETPGDDDDEDVDPDLAWNLTGDRLVQESPTPVTLSDGSTLDNVASYTVSLATGTDVPSGSEVSVLLTLTLPGGAGGAEAADLNDPASGLAEAFRSAIEAGAQLTFGAGTVTAELVTDSAGVVSVRLTVDGVDGDATASFSFDLTAVDDLLDEAVESYTVSLSGSQLNDEAVGTANDAVTTAIVDNDGDDDDDVSDVPIATVSGAPVVPEGTDAEFEISLSNLSEFDSPVRFTLESGTATGGDPAVDGSGVTVDFDNTEVVVVFEDGSTEQLEVDPTTGEFEVIIPAGDRSVDIRVTTIDEPGQETYEGEEQFTINLVETADGDRDTAPVLVDEDLTPGQIAATGTIVDDERADDDDESDVPYATIHGAPAVPEGALAGFQVQLSNPTALTVPTVVGFTLGATGDTADGGLGTGDGVTVDYDNTVVTVVYGDGSTATLTPDSGVFTLTYPTGVTTANIFVRTLDETGEDIYEGDETFTVELVQLGLDEDATVLVDETGAQGPVSAVGTIFDDETPGDDDDEDVDPDLAWNLTGDRLVQESPTPVTLSDGSTLDNVASYTVSLATGTDVPSGSEVSVLLTLTLPGGAGGAEAADLNDPASGLAEAFRSAIEAGAQLTFGAGTVTAELVTDSAGVVSVRLTVDGVDGDATASFSFDLTAVDDLLDEAVESYTVSLSGSQLNDEAVGTANDAVTTAIVDNDGDDDDDVSDVPIATVSGAPVVPEGTDAEFEISLSNLSEFDSPVRFTLESGTATGGDPAVDGSGVTVDFDNTEVVVVFEDGSTEQLEVDPTTGEFEVIIPAGDRSVDIRVTTIDEPGQETYEGEEQFTINLVETADGDRDAATVLVDEDLTPGETTATGTIVDDERADDDESDVPYATIHGAPVVPEGALAGFQVQLSNPTALTVPTVVGFTLNDGSAVGGGVDGDGVAVDYVETVVTVVYGDGSTATLTPDSGVFTLTYPTGVTTANIFVRTLDETGEDIYEGDETFTVELVQLGLDEDATVLVDETGAQGPVSAVGTIFDDETPGDDDDEDVDPDLAWNLTGDRLVQESPTPVTLSDGSTLDNVASYTVSLATGTDVPSGSEVSVLLTLTLPGGAGGAEAADLNDPASGLAEAFRSAIEAGAQLTFGAGTVTAELVTDSAGVVSVRLTVDGVDGDATASFSFDLTAVDDLLDEAVESYTVSLSGSQLNDEAVGTANDAVTTAIVDNDGDDDDDVSDVPIATVSGAPVVPEGTDAEFEISLSNLSEFDSPVRFTLESGTATGGDPAVDGSGVTVDFDNTEVVVVFEDGSTEQLEVDPTTGEFEVIIPAGDRSVDIRVTTIDEPGQETYEGEEQFTINLVETADGDRDTAPVLVDEDLTPGETTATGTIVDDERADDDDESDVPYATIHGAPVVPEGALAGFQVQLSNPTALTVPTVVGFTLGATGDTADGGLGTGDGVTVDYDNTVVTVVYGDGSTATLTPDSGVFTLTYPTGVTTANIFVRTLDETGEDIYEGDETFTVELVQLGLDEDATVLVDDTGAQGPVSAVGTIFDDETPPGDDDDDADPDLLWKLSGDALVSEAAQVTLPAGTVVDNTATYTVDVTTGGSVPAGTPVSVLLTLTLPGDPAADPADPGAEAEDLEFSTTLADAFQAAIQSGAEAAFGPPATVTTVVEIDTAGVVSVRLTVSGADLSGTESFTFDLTAFDDVLEEPLESYTVSLSGSELDGAAEGTANDTVTTSIIDNDGDGDDDDDVSDVPIATVSGAPVVPEGTDAQFVISLSNPSEFDSPIRFTLNDVTTETNGGQTGVNPDYNNMTVEVVFEDGSTDQLDVDPTTGAFEVLIPAGDRVAEIRVTTLDEPDGDEVYEGDEQFTIKLVETDPLVAADAPVLVDGDLGPIEATGTIYDDEGPGADDDDDVDDNIVWSLTGPEFVTEGDAATGYMLSFDVPTNSNVSDGDIATVRLTFSLPGGDFGAESADFEQAFFDEFESQLPSGVSAELVGSTVGGNPGVGSVVVDVSFTVGTADSMTFELQTFEDSVDENNETYSLGISDSRVNGDPLGVANDGVTTAIVDDDTPPGGDDDDDDDDDVESDVPCATIDGGSAIYEGEQDELTVMLTNASEFVSTVNVQLRDGSLTSPLDPAQGGAPNSGLDYDNTIIEARIDSDGNGTFEWVALDEAEDEFGAVIPGQFVLNFAPLETSIDIRVTTLDDTLDEENEVFTVELVQVGSDADTTVLVDETKGQIRDTVTIIDNDLPPQPNDETEIVREAALGPSIGTPFSNGTDPDSDEESAPNDRDGDDVTALGYTFGAAGPSTTVDPFVWDDSVAADADEGAGDEGAFSGLTSGGAPIAITVSDDGLTLTGTANGGPYNGQAIFQVTVTDVEGGEYTFDLLGPIDHPDVGETEDEDVIELTFTYTITDDNGVTAPGTLNIQVWDDAPVAKLEPTDGRPLVLDETVSDVFLPGDPNANDEGDTTTLDAIGFDTVTADELFNDVSDAGADGLQSREYGLSIDTSVPTDLVDAATNQNIVLQQLQDGLVQGHIGSIFDAVAFTVFINPTTGTVIVTQFSALRHDNPDDPDEESTPEVMAAGALSLTVTVTDNDGDTATDEIDLGSRIAFEDDGPTIGEIEVSGGPATVDETVPSGDEVPGALGQAVLTLGLSVPVDFGEDGPAAGAQPVWTLSLATGVTPGVDSGLDTTEGVDVQLFVENGAIVGRAGGPSGVEVLRLDIDASSGEVTVTQFESLNHPVTTDPNDVVELASGLIEAVVTATDGDGDSVSDREDLGGQIRFADDGPTIGEIEVSGGPATVDETVPSGDEVPGALGQAVLTLGLSAPVDFGQDGPAAGAQPVWTLSLATGVTPGVDSGLDTTEGVDVQLFVENGAIVGRAGGPSGVEVLRLDIDASSGEVTVTQFESLNHPVTTDPNDVVELASGLIEAVVTATDGDGDSVSDREDLGGQIRFADDGPTIGEIEVSGGPATVDETVPSGDEVPGALGQAVLTLGLSVPVDFGEDGPAAGAQPVWTLSLATGVTPGVDSGLDTTEGVDVQLFVENGAIVGRAGGPSGVEVLRLDIDASSGEVTVTQFESLNHPVTTDPNDVVELASGLIEAVVTATDGDGDSVSDREDLGGQIRFADDGPTIGEIEVSGGPATVDETVPSGDEVPGALGQAVLTLGLSVPVDFGEDGPAAGAQPVWTLSLATGVTPGVDSGLDTTEGVDVQLFVENGAIVGRAGGPSGVEVLRLDIDASSGEVTVTQFESLNHPVTTDPNDVVELASGLIEAVVTATDGDGDSVSDREDLGGQIRFADDGPTIGEIEVSGGPATVDETVPSGDEVPGALGQAVLTLGLSVPVDFGEDGPAAGAQPVWTLSLATGVTPGVDSGLDTTEGVDVQLFVENGAIVGRAGGPSGVEVLRLDIDASSGEVTVTQFESLNHPVTTDPNDVVELASGLIEAVVTATDGDGDSVSDREDLGGQIRFADDGPTIGEIEVSGGPATVDETVPSGDEVPGALGQAVLTLGLSVPVDFGEDGPAAGAQPVWTLSLATGVTPGVDSGLDTTEGVDVQLFVENGAIVGRAGGPSGVEVLRLDIDASSGEVTVTQFESLNHPVTTDPNDVVELASGLIEAVVTATDGDGDSVSDREDLGGQIRFADDGPTIGEIEVSGGPATVDETVPSGDEVPGALGQAVLTLGLSVPVDFGEDGPAAGAQPVWTLSLATGVTPGVDSGLDTTEGVDVQLFVENGAIVGRAGGPSGVEVLRLDIDASSGEVTVTQFESLNHPVTTDPNDVVELASGLIEAVVTATDGDGDSVSDREDLGGQIRFADDGPTIGEIEVSGGPATVDETVPSGDEVPGALGQAVLTLGLSVPVDFGEDGPAAGAQPVWTLSLATGVTPGVDSGLDTTEGVDVQLFVENGAIVGRAGGPSGVEVLRLDIDASSGEVTVTQFESLNHPVTTDPNDVVELASGLIEAVVTATDGDGDSVSDREDLGGQIRFADDGPTASITLLDGAMVTHDETPGLQDDDTPDPDVAALFDGLDLPIGSDPDMPAGFAQSDGPVVAFSSTGGEDGLVSEVFSLEVAGSDGASSGLRTTEGDEIFLFEEDGLVVGRVGDADGEAAFAVSINADSGVVSIAQYLSLKHPDTSSVDEPVDLGDTINAVVTATDGDGDMDTASVGIGGRIRFEDDGPTCTPDTGTVTEVAPQPVALTFVLDVSGSMGDPADPNGPDDGPTRLDVAKDALIELVNEYNAIGASVTVSLVTFSDLAADRGTFSFSEGDTDGLDALINVINGLGDGGFTNYPAGLETAQDVLEGVLPNLTPDTVNRVYFLSDGEPNVLGGGPGIPGSGSDTSAQEREDALNAIEAFNNFLGTAAAGIDDSETIAVGLGFDQNGPANDFLDELNSTTDGPIFVEDFDDLVGTLVDTVPDVGSSTSGNVLTDGAGDSFGADGGSGIQSVTVGSVTFGIDGSGNLTEVGTRPDGVSAEVNGSSLIITTAFGTLDINLDSGDYTYTGNPSVFHDQTTGNDDVVQDVFGYTIADGDGDTATCNLTIDIIDDEPVARNDVAAFDSVPIANFNVTIMLDRSGSMDDPVDVPDGQGGTTEVSRFELAIDSLKTLLDSFGDVAGAITINIGSFGKGTGDLRVGFTSVQAAQAALDDLARITPDGNTPYDEAIEELEGLINSDSFPDASTDPAQTNIVYFLSDGEPNPSNTGLTESEEDDWEQLLASKGVEVIAVGIGADIASDDDAVGELRQVAFPDDKVLIVEDENDLTADLQDTVPDPELTGNVLTNDSLGADGGLFGPGSAVTNIRATDDQGNLTDPVSLELAGDTVMIDGQFGTLTIDAEGNYTYTLTADPEDLFDIVSFGQSDYENLLPDNGFDSGNVVTSLDLGGITVFVADTNNDPFMGTTQSLVLDDDSGNNYPPSIGIDRAAGGSDRIVGDEERIGLRFDGPTQQVQFTVADFRNNIGSGELDETQLNWVAFRTDDNGNRTEVASGEFLGQDVIGVSSSFDLVTLNLDSDDFGNQDIDEIVLFAEDGNSWVLHSARSITGGEVDTFNYEITDGDGDTETAFLTVQIPAPDGSLPDLPPGQGTDDNGTTGTSGSGSDDNSVNSILFSSYVSGGAGAGSLLDDDGGAVPIAFNPLGDDAAAAGQPIIIAHDAAFDVAATSLSLWFKSDSDADGTLISKAGTDGSTDISVRVSDDGKFLLDYRDASGTLLEWQSRDTVARSGQWNHLVVTFGAAGIFIYLNGAEVAAADLVAGNPDTPDDPSTVTDVRVSDQPWVLGAEAEAVADAASADPTSSGSVDVFDGDLDDFAVYGGDGPGDTLSEEEVAALYTTGAPGLSTRNADGVIVDVAASGTDGDDTLVVDAADLTSGVLIDGGDGFDTLTFSDDDLDLDGTLLANVSNIEEIDLSGGSATVLSLTADDVLDLTGSDNTLFVTTDDTGLDTLNLTGDFVETQSPVAAPEVEGVVMQGTFKEFTANAGTAQEVKVYVDPDVDVTTS